MLSIIIVSYNTCGLLKQCLNSLKVHCPDAEVIVVDNASHDGSANLVKSEFPTAKLIPLPKNVGFAGANNIGAKHARGDFVVLLNSDTYVEDDSLTRCHNWMIANPLVGASSPRLIGFDGVPQPCAHPFPSFQYKLRQALWMSPRQSEEGAPGWLIGAALMLRTEAMQKLDVFLDTSYFMYWEDTDLCTRLLRAGWKLATYQEGYVRHLGGASSTGKQGGQRPALHACFVQGQYRWFARYRPRWESLALWALEGTEVCRKYLRGIVRPNQRSECIQARTLAFVLWGLLTRQVVKRAW